MNRYASNLPRAAWILGAAALGAAVMYVLDPEQGSRRRALARDKAHSARVKARKSFDSASRDLANRTRGLRAGASHLLPKKSPPAPAQAPMIEV